MTEDVGPVEMITNPAVVIVSWGRTATGDTASGPRTTIGARRVCAGSGAAGGVQARMPARNFGTRNVIFVPDPSSVSTARP